MRAMLSGRGGWTRFHNRNERVTVDLATGGVRCEWRFTSELHLCNVSPFAARVLFHRSLRDWPISLAGQPDAGARPRVSFIIGHRGESRRSHLLTTLATIGGQRGVPIECIVVEQSHRPTLPPHLPDWVRYVHTPIESDDLPYNRSWAFNVGARMAEAPLLILHDNDFLVPGSYARELVARHDEGWELIDLKRMMFYLSPTSTEWIIRERTIPDRVTIEHVTQNLLGGGSVVMDREAYFEIGGFDESFVGWGGEDNDFWERAETRRCWKLGYLPLVHLWHAPQPEKRSDSLSEGQRRYYERSGTAPSERIETLRGLPIGRVDGPVQRSR